MFKRVTWIGMGLVAGLGASKWVERKARRSLSRVLPLQRLPVRAGAVLVERARKGARGRAYAARGALEVGRAAMEARQGELREQLYTRARDTQVVDLRPVTNPSNTISLPPSPSVRATSVRGNRRRRSPSP